MILIKKAHYESDKGFLWDMLYEAALVDPAIQKMDRAEVLKLPSISKYLLNWGRESDCALIAYDQASKKYVGAIWFRLFPKRDAGYGYIADGIPELSMAVVPEWRGQGIGLLLLKAIIVEVQRQGYQALSLSVNKNNSARRLYERVGFVDADISATDDASITLILDMGRDKN